jgi:hypothetical protein
MTDPQHQAMELMNALLDGEVTKEQAAQIDLLIRSDPAFRDAVERLQHGEGRLRQLYTPSTAARTRMPDASANGNAPARTVGKSRLMRRALAYAAMLLLVAGAVFFASQVPHQSRLQVAVLHNDFVQDPVPATVCDTPEKFLAYTHEHLGVGIQARFDLGVQWVGWRGAGPGYDQDDSRTRVLLVFAPGGEPVVVLFQPSDVKRPQRRAFSGLSVFNKSMGDVTAYEITPLNTPVALNALKPFP